jgi:hypothetical protein
MASKLAPFFNDIARRYRDGESAASIGRYYKATTTTVTSFLKKHGLMIARGRGEVDEAVIQDRQLAIELFNDGLRPSQILDEVGRSKSWLYTTLNQAGCDLRGIDSWQPSEENMRNAAVAKEESGAMNDSEKLVYNALVRNGWDPTPQLAFGSKNADFGIQSCSVAIEVCCRGTFRKYLNSGSLSDRIVELGSLGWSVYVLVSSDFEQLRADGVEDMLDWIYFADRSPAVSREYRVVRSPSELLAGGQLDPEEVSRVLTKVQRLNRT